MAVGPGALTLPSLGLVGIDPNHRESRLRDTYEFRYRSRVKFLATSCRRGAYENDVTGHAQTVTTPTPHAFSLRSFV
jgi:hypothetical protein